MSTNVTTVGTANFSVAVCATLVAEQLPRRRYVSSARERDNYLAQPASLRDARTSSSAAHPVVGQERRDVQPAAVWVGRKWRALHVAAMAGTHAAVSAAGEAARFAGVVETCR